MTSTKRERAIEAAAKARFLAGTTLSQNHLAYHWDEAMRHKVAWVTDQINDMTAAIKAFERIMAEPDEGAQ